jgi:hypothetical protein
MVFLPGDQIFMMKGTYFGLYGTMLEVLPKEVGKHRVYVYGTGIVLVPVEAIDPFKIKHLTEGTLTLSDTSSVASNDSTETKPRDLGDTVVTKVLVDLVAQSFVEEDEKSIMAWLEILKVRIDYFIRLAKIRNEYE